MTADIQRQRQADQLPDSEYLRHYPGFRVLKRHVVENPVISVLVRVKNEVRAIGPFLDSVRKQTIFDRTEVVVLDSGSTDGTVETVLKFPASLYQIAPEEFSFGDSCNLICSLASSPVLCLMSGHISFSATDLLDRAAAAVDPQSLSAGYLRQIPNLEQGSSSYERAWLKHRFPSGLAKVRLYRGRHSFSNAASVFSAVSWKRIPFPSIQASEDFFWAESLLARAGEVSYLPYLEVAHSHNETPADAYRRVKINVEARGSRRRWLSGGKYLLGVTVSCLREGASPAEALRYGLAHARPYVFL